MNHSEFFKLIKKGLPCGAYLLHGEEEYVKEQALKAVENTVEEDFRPFNYAILNKPAPQELYESCGTLPLFSDKRFVVCSELADGVEAAKYARVIDELPAETALLFVFKGKLAANSSILKLVKKTGQEVVFDKLSPQERAAWCIKHCGEAGVLLDGSCARILVNAVGDDMANIVSETDKLIDFVGPGNAVTPQDISVCIRTAVDVRIFDMLDMFTYGKPGDGILALHALLDESNEPMSVAAFLTSRFKLMLEARRGIDSGRQKREVASRMEGNQFANEKAYDAARRFTQKELMGLISDLSDTSFLKISGTMKDDKYLELVLLKHEWRQFPV
ncbi:MAG: DNA polymerase III subunit delta [Clostridiales bacterium]|nr:DNA polymerase III subunit delta [Clostridiales bacterium]